MSAPRIANNRIEPLTSVSRSSLQKLRLFAFHLFCLIAFLLSANWSGLAATAANPAEIVISNGVPVIVPLDLKSTNAVLNRPVANAAKSLRRYLTLIGGIAVGGILIGLAVLLQEKYPPPRSTPVRTIRPVKALRPHPDRKALGRSKR